MWDELPFKLEELEQQQHVSGGLVVCPHPSVQFVPNTIDWVHVRTTGREVHPVDPILLDEIIEEEVGEEDMSPVLASPPGMAASPGQTSSTMRPCQQETFVWTATPQRDVMKAVPDGRFAHVSVGRRPESPSDDPGGDLPLLQRLPLDESILAWSRLLRETRPRPLIDAVGGQDPLVESHDHRVRYSQSSGDLAF